MASAGADDTPVAAELLTPPLGLVALLGRPDLHPAIRDVLRNEARPPMECLSAGELTDAPSVLIPRKRSRPPADPLAAAAALAAVNPAASVAGGVPGVVPGIIVSTNTNGMATPGGTTGTTPNQPQPTQLAHSIGHLKRGWLGKHRRMRPALALLFIDRTDVEGDPNQWMALGVKLDAARSAADAADCKLAVVVVDDDSTGSHALQLSNDRAASLRSKLKIDPRALQTMSLPPTPDSTQAIASLCKTLFAEHYGKESARRAALTHVPDDINATAAKPAFKAAVFCEFKGDWSEALRWYKRAHSALLNGVNLRRASVETHNAYATQNHFALLNLAASACYKTCALSLMLDPQAPRDAVDFFAQHTLAFKKPLSSFPRQALPEFFKWVTDQYLWFGALLQSRVKWGGDVCDVRDGSDPLKGHETSSKPSNFSPPPPGSPRTFLPAWYFHAASSFAEKRRAACEAVSDAMEDVGHVGQTIDLKPGIRDGSFNAVDGSTVDDYMFLQYVNRNVGDDLKSIPMKRVKWLAKALAHYKHALVSDATRNGVTHGRLFASLTSQLASGYLASGDVKAAQTLFTSVARAYRREGWDDLLANSLMSLKECQRVQGNRRSYLITCLELAALGAEGTTVLDGHDHFDADAAAAAAEAALTEVGSATGSSENNTIEVFGGDLFRGPETSNGADRAFRVIGGFKAVRAVPGEQTQFTAGVKWCLPFEVNVASVSVEFSESQYTRILDVNSENKERCPSVLTPNIWHQIEFDVVPRWGHPACVAAVCVTLDTGITFRAMLGGAGGADERKAAKSSEKKNRLPDFLADVKVGVHVLDLHGAAPRVSLQASFVGPALLGEACALPLAVVSTGDVLDNVTLGFRVRSAGASTSDFETDKKENHEIEVTCDGIGDPLGASDSINVGRISPGVEWRGLVYVRRRTLGPPSTLAVELRGEKERDGGDETEPSTKTQLETEIEVPVQAPFSSTQTSTGEFRTHALCFPGDGLGVENTRVFTKVRVGGSSSRLAVTGVGDKSNTANENGKNVPAAFPLALTEGDEFLVVSESKRGAPEPALEVSWQRANAVDGSLGTNTTAKETQTILDSAKSEPSTTQKPPPLTIATNAPDRIFVGSPFPMICTFKNATPQTQVVRVRVTDASGFVFAGARDEVIQVAPGSEFETSYSCVALKSGALLLPELECTAVRFGKVLTLPKVSRAIYVEP